MFLFAMEQSYRLEPGFIFELFSSLVDMLLLI